MESPSNIRPILEDNTTFNGSDRRARSRLKYTVRDDRNTQAKVPNGIQSIVNLTAERLGGASLGGELTWTTDGWRSPPTNEGESARRCIKGVILVWPQILTYYPHQFSCLLVNFEHVRSMRVKSRLRKCWWGWIIVPLPSIRLLLVCSGPTYRFLNLVHRSTGIRSLQTEIASRIPDFDICG